MGLYSEARLDNTIPHGKFGDAEPVEVLTRMGHVVSRGNVLSVTPFGLIVRESTGDTKFYKEELYLFVPLQPEPSTIIRDELHDMSVDSRVQVKLAAMEAGDPTPSNTNAKKLEPDDEESKDKGENEKGAEDKGSKGDKQKDSDKNGVEEPKKTDDPVDVDSLPDDIKRAVVSVKDMDEGQVNSIMSDISDAAMRALKRISIDETEIFGLIQKIQDSVIDILKKRNAAKR